MKQIPASLLTLTAGILVTLISFWVGHSYSLLLPEQASEQAPLVDSFFGVMLGIGTALFLVVQGAILLFMIQFRHRPGDDTDGLPVEGNVSLEIFWTAIPAIIVIGLGIYSVSVYAEMGGFEPEAQLTMAHHHHTPNQSPMIASAMAAPLVAESDLAEATPDSEALEFLEEDEETAPERLRYGIGARPNGGPHPADLEVNVQGLQYAWVFEYPSDEIISGELHVPVGQEVQLNISASDVIHSFWVPQFRLKQDAIPGQPTQLHFKATQEGTYPVVCAELCGAYHGSMRTKIVVEPEETFEDWLDEMYYAQRLDEGNDPQTIGDRPVDPGLLLASRAKEWGIDAQTLTQLHSESEGSTP